jgi:hypothetical protein
VSLLSNFQISYSLNSSLQVFHEGASSQGCHGGGEAPHIPHYLGRQDFATLHVTHAQIRAWSVPHLKFGCWYLNCTKGFCPKDEEDLKKSIDVTGGTIDLTAAADAEDPQEDDLEHLDEKEKKKAIARLEKEVEKARKKKERQEEKAAEKATEKSRKSG